MACSKSEIKISAFGLSPQKQSLGRKGKVMRNIVFNQGFNRVEHRQIISLERAKLNRLLDEERRFTETLIARVRREIEAGAQMLPSFEIVWNKIQNHSAMQNVRRRIDCLTDAYPQFLQQVSAVRIRLREKAKSCVEAARLVIQKASRATLPIVAS
jgi:plasmid maintenance system antidote protein VapI